MAKPTETIDSTYPGTSLVVPAQNYLDQLWNKLRPNEVSYTTGMQYGAESKYITAKFEQTLDRVELLHITDVQFGHVECRYDKLVEYRDWVLEKENRFMLWGGDMVDATTMFSPGTAWENLFEPQSQVYKFVELWAPARHRILGFVGGNHERRGNKTFGDFGLVLATLLKVPYSRGQQVIDIYFGEHKPFKIHLWHGKGSAVTKGAKAQTLHRFMQQGDSQLYLIGHLHDVVVLFDWRSIRQPGRQTVKLQKIGGAMSSSFLSFWGTYAEVAGLSPSDVMMAKCTLFADAHWELTVR